MNLLPALQRTSTYICFNSSPPKVSNIPSPVRFLRPSSVVDDFYTGELKSALEKISLSEMSFVMYYAPWDAESQRVRWHFEAAARYFHKEVSMMHVMGTLFLLFICIDVWQKSVFSLLILNATHSRGVVHPALVPSQHTYGIGKQQFSAPHRLSRGLN